MKVLLFGCMELDPLLPNGDGMGGVTVCWFMPPAEPAMELF